MRFDRNISSRIPTKMGAVLAASSVYLMTLFSSSVYADPPHRKYMAGLDTISIRDVSGNVSGRTGGFSRQHSSREKIAFNAAARARKNSFAAPSIPGGIFGSYAIQINGAPILARWKGISDEKPFYGACSSGCTFTERQYAAVVKQARDLPFSARLALINNRINRILDYASDRTVYETVDYWAAPEEALRRGRGDCEDFAIVKRAALVAAGVPSRSISLVVVHDEQRKVYHAVLSVRTDQGNFILDNATPHVFKDTAISHYSPLISISDQHVWVHGRKSGGAQLASVGAIGLDLAPGEGPPTDPFLP